jgi:hypothetical protein
LGSGKRAGVGVASGLGVAGTGVRVGVTRGNVGVGEGEGNGVNVGGTVGVGGTRVAVGGGGGSVMVGVGTRVGVGGALHPKTSKTSAVSASPVKNFPLTSFSPFSDKLMLRRCRTNLQICPAFYSEFSSACVR